MTHCTNSSCLKVGENVNTNFCIGCGGKIKPYQSDIYYHWLTPKVGLKMQHIPSGRYAMGSPDEREEFESTEKPQHFVSVNPFHISSSPISQLQYKTLMGMNPSVSQSYTHPVESVSYFDAIEFCRILSGQVEKNYRLPSEAEWEYACRANTTSLFYFGKTIDSKEFCHRSLEEKDLVTMPSAIESYPPNQFGLFDMHGGVWEWCEDRWHSNYIQAPLDGSAWMSDVNLNSRVIRGGSWADYSNFCRSASRTFLSQSKKLNNVGFRVVCEI